MVSISSAAPAASRIWRVAAMISGPMPSPYATVMGVLVGISEYTGYWNALHRARGDCERGEREYNHTRQLVLTQRRGDAEMRQGYPPPPGAGGAPGLLGPEGAGGLPDCCRRTSRSRSRGRPRCWCRW